MRVPHPAGVPGAAVGPAPPLLLTGLAVGLLATGCGESPPAERAASAARDSAGIMIVDNSAPRFAGESGWRLAETPTTTAGVVTGPPEEQLFNVSGAALLSDGRVVVGNQGSTELKVFDPAGTLLHSFGGEGEGPGEFLWVRSLDVGDEDSIFVWDQRLQRISVFSPETGFARSFQLSAPSDGGFPMYTGRFLDGGLLVQISTVVTEPLEDLEIRDARPTYYRYGGDGTPADSIGRFRGSRSMLKFHDGGDGLTILRVAFEPRTRLATGGADLFVGDGARYEVRRYDGAVDLALIIRRDHREIPITSDLIMRQFEKEYGSFADQPGYYEDVREAFAAMPAEGFVAAFDAIRATRNGHLWARSHPLPGDTEQAWSVFSTGGEWLSDVRMPAGLEVHDITHDAIVAVRRDELDIEQVVVHEIVRPSAGAS